MLVDKLIDKHRLTQRAALQAVGLARSTYCYKPRLESRSPKPLDAELSQAIYGVLKRASVYGYRKVHASLRVQGWSVNHKRVLRHMRRLGLTQPRKVKGRKFTHPEVRYPEVSNEYWEMDLSYVWCGNQQGYLFALIDACDKGIPGDNFGDRCRAQEAEKALETGVLKRFGGRVPVGHRLILRIDRGPQFRARRFRKAALRFGVELEYAGIQCPDDKPYIESFFGKYKVEEVYRNEYRDLTEARMGWELYRSWYETKRIHQSLNYQTPKQVWESQKLTLANESKMCNINQAPFCPE